MLHEECSIGQKILKTFSGDYDPQSKYIYIYINPEQLSDTVLRTIGARMLFLAL